MTSLRNYVGWYIHKRWTRWDLFWLSFQLALTIWIVSQPTTWLASTVVITVSLTMLAYSMGRRHQADADVDLVRDAATLSRDAARLLAECQIVEMWYFDLRPDPEKRGRLVIHSRVCPN